MPSSILEKSQEIKQQFPTKKLRYKLDSCSQVGNIDLTTPEQPTIPSLLLLQREGFLDLP